MPLKRFKMRETQKRRKNRDGRRKRIKDNARGWKRVGVFIIVRVIRHREIRGNDAEDDAVRVYAKSFGWLQRL